MKKQILDLGKSLNKIEQKKINGGFGFGGPVFPALKCTENNDCNKEAHLPGSTPLECIDGFCVHGEQ
ncbi:hypothetical protein [Tenacibaculum halocynthiae]|uniref:hypothetical protein n=1 Tax=Tenacibaculum halocynthiae TaxID=1254437 RepID=UPI003D662A8E